MRKKALIAGIVLVVLLVVGAGASHAQLSFGAGVNQSCISMRITYSLCGIIPYPCAYISFWQPKWIVSTRATQETTGRPHYHFHHAVVRPVDLLFTFSDPCSGCVVPTPASVVPAFYESVTDPAWRAAQAPVMSSTVQGAVDRTDPAASRGMGSYLSACRLRQSPFPRGGLRTGGRAGLQHHPAADRPVAGAGSCTSDDSSGAACARDRAVSVHVPAVHADPARVLPGRLRPGDADAVAGVADGHL